MKWYSRVIVSMAAIGITYCTPNGGNSTSSDSNGWEKNAQWANSQGVELEARNQYTLTYKDDKCEKDKEGKICCVDSEDTHMCLESELAKEVSRAYQHKSDEALTLQDVYDTSPITNQITQYPLRIHAREQVECSYIDKGEEMCCKNEIGLEVCFNNYVYDGIIEAYKEKSIGNTDVHVSKEWCIDPNNSVIYKIEGMEMIDINDLDIKKGTILPFCKTED